MPASFFIPVEVFRREFDAKGVLACYLASKGANVVFGHRWYVMSKALEYGQKGDFYLHNHTQSINDQEGLKHLVNKGIFLIGYEDESALHSVNYEDQVAFREQNQGFNIFDLWLCWGKKDYDYLTKTFVNLESFRNIGTPRSAIWGEFGKQLYKEDLDKIKSSNYGQYILIIGSFQFQATKAFKKQIVTANEKFQEFKKFSKILEQYISKDYFEAELEVFKTLSAIIKDIIENTSLNVILRPYFKEFSQLETKLKKIAPDRIFIDNRMSVSPLIIAAKAVIHSGSTAGIESNCFKIDTYVVNRQFNFGGFDTAQSTPSMFSYSANNNFSKMLSLEKPINTLNLSNFVTSPGDQVFYTRLYQEILKLNSLAFGGLAAIKFKKPPLSVMIYKMLSHIKRGNNFKYDRLKRSPIGLKYMKSLANKFRQTDNSISPLLSITKIENSTFYLRIKK